MRVTKPRDLQRAMASYIVVDHKDIAGLIGGIDAELKDFGLELVMADFASDGYMFRVDRRRNARKKEVGIDPEHSPKVSLQRRRVQRQARQKDISYMQF
jgi:hypothetical protein